jgi:hypothetical protein
MGFLLGFTFLEPGLTDRSKPLSFAKVKPHRVHAGALEMPTACRRSANVRSITQDSQRLCDSITGAEAFCAKRGNLAGYGRDGNMTRERNAAIDFE